ncbi:MAG TPA: hypothetical protein VF052_00205 [Solirubrobacterales bacterium]
MTKNHTYRRLAGLAVAAALSLALGSPLGVAQVTDPYGEQPPPVVETPGGTIGFAPSLPPPVPASADTSAQLKNCIKKAKKKFKNNPVKKKKAIKACKAKFG